MLRQIRKIGDPVLKKKAAKIDKVSADTRKLIADLIETMHSVHGIGLAAPQVGVSQRLAIVEVADPAAGDPLATKLTVLINPEIVKTSADTWVAPEGCLSIPGWRGEVERPYQITVKSLDRDGNRVRFDADGMYARAIQHEIDHLDGVLYLEKLVAPDRVWQVDENAPESA
jgi:peptide deformylase